MNIKDIFNQNDLFIQETSYTCGPASLLNVLHLKGDFSHTEKELAKLCKTKEGKGTAAKDLVTAAKQLGLEVVEEKPGAALKDIERNIDAGNYVIPCYQHLYSEDGHFGVITEQDDNFFYFRDPSYGFFRLRKKYLDKFWYGTEGLQKWYMAIK